MSERDNDEHKSIIGRLPDMVKSMIVLSLGGVFMAEETIRKLAGELKLPRDTMHLVINQADRSRKELIDAVAREVGRALRAMELEKLIGRLGHEFEIEIDARLTLSPRRTRQDGSRSSRGKRRLKIQIRPDRD
jgi:hypothetical protein